MKKIFDRVAGLVKSTSKFPTYRRRFRQVVKSLVTHALAKQGGSAGQETNTQASGFTGQATNTPASGFTGQVTNTPPSVKLGASDELV